MSKFRTLLISLTAAVLIAGCPLQPETGLSKGDVDGLLAIFNADLGDEGVPVSRRELQEAFRDDPELVSAVLSDLNGSSAESSMDAMRVDEDTREEAAAQRGSPSKAPAPGA